MAASGPFAEAYAAVDNIEALVSERIQQASDLSSSLREEARLAFEALSEFNLDDLQLALPVAPPNAIEVSADFEIDPVNATSFGSVNVSIPTAPTLDAVPSIGDLTIPEFTSMITGLSIPDAPEATAPIAAPEAPVTGTVTLPEEPTVALPTLPALDDVTIPEFVFPTLPDFDATAPEFEGTPVSNVLQWSNPTYAPEVVDEVIVKLREMWDGSLGLPEAVEQAMWERAAAREDLAVARAVSEAMLDFSSRGFTMPNGMLVARVDAIREEALLKKLGLNREITIQVAQWQVENVRLAVERAIAAENVLVNIFENMANRELDAAKTQLAFHLDVYNAQVALFNARQQAYSVAAQVYKTQLDAALSQIDVFKAQIEGEVARSQVNEQRVRAYSATVDGVRAIVDVYKAKMEGASIQSDVIRNQIEAYKAEVQAYGERVQADKVRFEAYEARVRGESAKAGIIDAEARAYSATIQGKTAIADLDTKRAELAISRNRQTVEAYAAQLQAVRADIESQQATIQVAAQAYTADTQRFAAQASAEADKARVEIAGEEATMRSNISLYEAHTKNYIAHMEQLIRKAQLQLEALQSAAQVASTLAAGAMAGVSVGANLSGSGSVGASGSVTESSSDSYSESHNYNY